ncbi:MAG: bacteriohemerythrin [Acetatifactor sp.]|nr:bacteriohemerythrin [Acetatifactor sp.]
MGEIHLWKEQYKIGNKVIDEQHYQLFCKIENLLAIAKEGDIEKKRKECFELIEFLIDYTKFHFESEEKIQREMQYVGYTQHIWIHQNFVQTIQQYKEKLERDFSLDILKSFAGTLLTWLAQHVCGCDRKIMSNIPLEDQSALAGAAENIDLIVSKLLEDSYGLKVRSAKSCLYKGFAEGKVFVRRVVTGKNQYVFLYGLSEQIARELYFSLSSLQIEDIENLDEIESSALTEITNVMSTYIIGILSDEPAADLKYQDAVFTKEYTDETYNLRDGVAISIETDHGNMEVLYCQIK